MQDGSSESNYSGNGKNVGRNFIEIDSKKICKAVKSKCKLQTFEYIDQQRVLKIRNIREHPIAYKITIVWYVILAIKTSNNYNKFGVLGAKSTSEVYM